MKQEDISRFIGIDVKLSFQNGFILKGIIDKVTNETVYFSTNQTESIIDINSIASITLIKQ